MTDKMLLSKSILLCLVFLMTMAPAQSSEISYEKCPTLEYIDMKTGGNIDPLFAPAALCASIQGFTYEILEPKWEKYPQIWVRKVVDLDGDGMDEALVQ